MLRLTLLLAGLTACTAAPTGARAPVAVPADLTARISEAQRLGQAIFEQDLASSRASDAVLEAMGPQPDERVQGWITRRNGQRWRVQFINAEPPFVALWEVDVGSFGGAVTARPLDPPEPLDAEGNAMARARATAVAHPFRACSSRYNTVVLPGELTAQRGHLVYLLAATNSEGDWIVGGHQRFLISADGARVLEHQPLSRGCFAVPASPSHSKAGAWVTHIVGDSPAETHVFLSLLHQAPLFVGTRRGVWKVSGEKISFEGDDGG